MTRNSKSSGTSISARNPAIRTRSTRAVRHRPNIDAENSGTPANALRETTSQFNPALQARATPPQSARLAMTSETSAGSRPAAICSMKFMSVVPPPEIKTPKRIGRSRGAKTVRQDSALPRADMGFGIADFGFWILDFGDFSGIVSTLSPGRRILSRALQRMSLMRLVLRRAGRDTSVDTISSFRIIP